MASDEQVRLVRAGAGIGELQDQHRTDHAGKCGQLEPGGEQPGLQIRPAGGVIGQADVEVEEDDEATPAEHDHHHARLPRSQGEAMTVAIRDHVLPSERHGDAQDEGESGEDRRGEVGVHRGRLRSRNDSDQRFDGETGA